MAKGDGLDSVAMSAQLKTPSPYIMTATGISQRGMSIISLSLSRRCDTDLQGVKLASANAKNLCPDSRVDNCSTPSNELVNKYSGQRTWSPGTNKRTQTVNKFPNKSSTD